MSAKRPSEPSMTGIFFDYPPDAVGHASDYWMAAGGETFRMTGACKRALLATFEAVMERAVAVANFSDTMSGVTDLADADFSKLAPPFSVIDLGRWARASGRAGIGGKLVRGCPMEEWSLLVSLAWALWAGQSITLSHNVKTIDIYTWQDRLLDFETAGWIPDDIDHIIEIEQPFDIGSMPCDNQYRDSETPIYAPWGDYHGGQGRTSTVSAWIEHQLVAAGRDIDHIYTLGSAQMEDTMAGSLLSGHQHHPLGMISDGKIGNWMGVGQGAAAQTTTRRSGAEWAVIQAMLANMCYTHVGFSYSATYRYVQTTRTWTRYFSLDPATLDFVLVDEASSPQDTVDYNEAVDALYSGSYIGNSSAQAGSLIVFGIEKDSSLEQDLVLTDPPPDSDVDIDGRDYVLSVLEYWPGAMSVSCTAYETTDVVSVTSHVPVPYPAQAFEAYVHKRGGAAFVDTKVSSKDDVPSHSVKIEGDGAGGLAYSARRHAYWLLSQVDPPRSFPSPAPIASADVQRASDALWRSFKLRYPDQPNYPANDPSADRYFPIGIVDQAGNPHYFIEGNHEYTTDGGVNVTFGELALAFPDAPFGWDDDEWFSIVANTSALAGYEWRFKAMPAE